MFSNKFIFKLLGTVAALMASTHIYAETSIVFDNPITSESGGPKPDFVSTEDINNDGYEDLLISTEQKLHFLMGDGSGNLEKNATIRLDATGTGAALGDYNNDGNLDIAISLMTSNSEFSYWYRPPVIKTTEIYLSDGAIKPSFTQVSSLSYYGGKNIQAEDFNGDGLDDLLINGQVLLNQGEGDFQAGDNLSLSDYYQSQLSGTFTTDINNDDNLDIIYAGAFTFCGNGDGTFDLCPDFAVKKGNLVGDFNGDGLIDIIETKVVSFKQIPYTSYSGGGCGTVVSYSYGGRRGNRSRGGRGRIRFTRCYPSYKVTSYRSEPETSKLIVKLQNEDGTFEEISSPVINGEFTQHDIVDLDGDGLTDVVVRLKNESGVSIFRGLGDGELANKVAMPNAPSVLSFADFNEDGLPDIVYVALSIPSKADSDAWAFVHLQQSSASNTGTESGTGTGTGTGDTTPTTPPDATGGTGEGSGNNFPAIDPNGETLELEGTISELFSDHFVIDGITIWFDNSTAIKYESGYILEVGGSAQVEADPNLDGSGTAIKIQVGPL